MQWIVLKQEAGIKLAYGPITAPSAREAVRRLAEGDTGKSPGYVATHRGRYHALPLSVWQDGTFDYTKARGTEAVGF